MPQTDNSLEIRVGGRWLAVPSLDVKGKKLYASGTWLRTARVRSEEWLEDELSNPEVYVEELEGSGANC